ncbi:MAG TPA: hypothetical protein VJL08_01065 [Dehalococcoidia bacterium]|nr:hypothetical protein [Dehalococcoidia bacterium]
MATESELVDCPTCGGEGMIQHCGQAAVCWRCKGLGEVTREEAAKQPAV